MALSGAKQLNIEEGMRFAGSRNDPARMAQNFAGVSGANDGRNDIIIRGNSPSGVLWRAEGVDIPNPNHFSTFGATGGPVTILNTNTLRTSSFLTGAFPADYGNALAGAFDLRLRNGNKDKYEMLAQVGFNGFEAAAEGPLGKRGGASFLVDYRYSLIAAVHALGLSVGTGASVPNYQDLTVKINVPTKKAGTFGLFAMGGLSNIHFVPGKIPPTCITQVTMKCSIHPIPVWWVLHMRSTSRPGLMAALLPLFPRRKAKWITSSRRMTCGASAGWIWIIA